MTGQIYFDESDRFRRVKGILTGHREVCDSSGEHDAEIDR